MNYGSENVISPEEKVLVEVEIGKKSSLEGWLERSRCESPMEISIRTVLK